MHLDLNMNSPSCRFKDKMERVKSITIPGDEDILSHAVSTREEMKRTIPQ